MRVEARLKTALVFPVLVIKTLGSFPKLPVRTCVALAMVLLLLVCRSVRLDPRQAAKLPRPGGAFWGKPAQAAGQAAPQGCRRQRDSR
jgi:hypothetical protein